MFSSFFDSLLWANDGDSVSADKKGSELSRRFTVLVFLGFTKHDIDVDVKGLKQANILASVLEFDQNPLIACPIEGI
jgi:VCBS repeat-containing protein